MEDLMLIKTGAVLLSGIYFPSRDSVVLLILKIIFKKVNSKKPSIPGVMTAY